ncbi:MAG: DNA-directed RNA polymerase subunit K [Candidatus Norongarragalinales archaeon]
MKAQDLTKYERARIVGARALQLAMGAPPLVKAANTISPVKLAQIELEKNVIPLFVVRRS